MDCSAGTIYLYGTRLQEGLAEHGQLSCIAQVRNGSVVFWHCVKKARYTISRYAVLLLISLQMPISWSFSQMRSA